MEACEKIIKEGRDCLCCYKALVIEDAKKHHSRGTMIPYYCSSCYNINKVIFDVNVEADLFKSYVLPGKTLQITYIVYARHSPADFNITIKYPLINLFKEDDIAPDSSIDIKNKILTTYYKTDVACFGGYESDPDEEEYTMIKAIVYDGGDISQDETERFDKDQHIFNLFFV